MFQTINLNILNVRSLSLQARLGAGEGRGTLDQRQYSLRQKIRIDWNQGKSSLSCDGPIKICQTQQANAESATARVQRWKNDNEPDRSTRQKNH
jgi:hypothetical protein